MQLSLKWKLKLKHGSNTYLNFDIIFEVQCLKHFPNFFWSKTHMILKFKKLGIQCFKQLSNRISNKGDMTS